MDWQLNSYATFVIITAIVLVVLAFYVWRRRRTPGAAVGTWLMLVIAGWSLGYALELGSPEFSAKLFWSNVNFLGLVTAPIMWLTFVLQYIHRDRWLTRRRLILLALPSLVTLVLVWTNPTHGLIRSAARLDVDGPIPVLGVTYDVGFWAFWVYASLLIVLGSGLLLHTLVAAPGLYRRQTAALLVSALIPWIGNVLYLVDLNSLHGLDLTPFSFAITGMAMAWGLFRFRLFDIVPIARDVVLESMDDGVMVLDAQNRIVDVNPTAGRVIGRPVSEIIGQPAGQVLSAWPDLVERHRDITETRTEIVLGTGGRQRYYDLHISPLYDQRDRLAGRLFVLRNISGRKRSEELLQKESETFFSILQRALYGVLLIDQDGRCLYANPKFTHITGQTLGDIPTLSDWFRQAFPDPAYRREVVEHWKTDTTHRVSRVFSVVNKDGEVREVESRPTLLDDGRAVLMLSDITERKRAEERLQQRSRELALLNRASQAFNSPLDVDQVLTTVLEGFRHLMDVTACSIWLIDLETDELVCQQATGPSDEVVRGWRLAPWQGIAGWTVRTGKSLIVRDTHADERHFKGVDQQTGLTMRSVLSVPLRVKQNVIGVLQAADTQVDRFDTEDLALLKLLAGSAAIAIENARLFEQARQEITERKRVEEALRESEEKFRNLAEQSPNMIFINKKGRVVYANKRCEEVMGYTRDEFYAAEFDFLTLIASEHGGLVKANFSRHMKGEEIEPSEYALVAKDGTRLEVVLTTRLIDYQGERAILGTVTDITERKQAEAERERLLAQVREQAQRVQQIIDTVPEGVLLLDADGQIILANPVAEGDLAALADAEAGDTVTHLGDRPLEELLTSPPKGLWHEVAANGRRFEVIARPIEARTKVGGWVLVTRDVTQQREVEQYVQQQERLAAVGQLAAGIAHDFKNILATIVLYAQMAAQSQGMSARDRERMATINQQAQHATKLINQVQDFSGRSVLERQPLDLLPLLKKQVTLLERTLPESIEIKLDYGLGQHTVNADPTRMQQMVTNLALNAREAMPEGGELRIGLERIQVQPGESPPLPEMEAGEWVRVTVSDTGTGILPDVLPHIFEPFFTTRGPGKGSGLGLPQVHGIVEQHRGRIDVETQVGRGTTFIIYLPALSIQSVETLTLALSDLAKGRGETILVVEDSVSARKAIVESLELLNYQVLEAANGQEALATLERYGDEIALVLSDVVMPGMGGIALLHALRARGLPARVVMLTGHPLEKELEGLRAQGMIDWLPKPPSLERLADVVARALDAD